MWSLRSHSAVPNFSNPPEKFQRSHPTASTHAGKPDRNHQQSLSDAIPCRATLLPAPVTHQQELKIFTLKILEKISIHDTLRSIDLNTSVIGKLKTF